MLFLIVINALYGLYICFPVLLVLFIYMYKEKFLCQRFYFLEFLFYFFILFFFLDGLVINNNNNLNIDFIFKNLNSIFFNNVKTGFFNILNSTQKLLKIIIIEQ